MIRIGLVGCGSMGPGFVGAAMSLHPRLDVTALVDIQRERAEKAAAKAPRARAATDYRAIADDVDAVVVALPHDLHHEAGMFFLGAGKHVLMEKPLANTERQCLDLIHAGDRARRVLSVGYVMRHDPLWSRFGELIREKTFGQPFSVSIWTEQHTDASRGAWIGQRRRVGGGQLFSHGCHYIDLMLSWLGRPVEGVHVGTNLGTPWMEREGTSHVVVRFESGALGYHAGTWGARGSVLRYSVHAHTPEGMLELDHAASTIAFHRHASGGDLPALQAAIAAGATAVSPSRTVLFRTDEGGKSVLAELEDFLTAIETGRPPRTDARAAMQSLRVIWRLYDAEERRVVADLRGLGLDQFRDEEILGGAGQAFPE